MAFMNVVQLTGLQGRWQKVRETPTVICDTGHNIGAWEYLSEQLQKVKCHEKRIVFGILEDKDIYAIMQKLPKNARYFWTKGTTKRAFPEESLRIFGEQFGLQGNSTPQWQKPIAQLLWKEHRPTISSLSEEAHTLLQIS